MKNKKKIFNFFSSDSFAFHQKLKIRIMKKPFWDNTQISKKRNENILYKSYPKSKKYILPSPAEEPGVSLRHALQNRRTEREFSSKPLSIQTISNLFYYSCGIKKNKDRRFYPSAGARYPLEIYFISSNSDLPQGAYHYGPKEHIFEYIAKRTILPADYVIQRLTHPAGLIVITAVFERICSKYGERGYRYILLEAGHVGQNFCLNAVAEKMICCSIGASLETKLERLLHVDGMAESIIYMFAIGNKIKTITP